MTPRIVDVTDIRHSVRTVFDAVAQEGVPYVLTRDGRPEVVMMIRYSDFQRHQALEASLVLARFDRMREWRLSNGAEFSDDEVAADVAEGRRSQC